MNFNKKEQMLQRLGALLLATFLCISAMVGCGTATQKKTAEKTPTRQSQQAAPKADPRKKDSGKKTSSGKTTSSQNGTNKPAGGHSSTNKPTGGHSSTNKPAESQRGTSKPADKKEAPSIKEQPQRVKVAIGSSFVYANDTDRR